MLKRHLEIAIFCVIAGLTTGKVAFSHETAIWQGAWANNSLSTLCIAIRNSTHVSGNNVNVFLAFPIKFTVGEAMDREILVDRTEFETDCQFDSETKSRITYLPPNKNSWESYIEKETQIPSGGMTVITLGHGSKGEVLGADDGKLRTSFPFSYLSKLATSLPGKRRVSYISDTCYSSNQLSSANDTLPNEKKVCGLTSIWNNSHLAGGEGPIPYLDRDASLSTAQTSANFSALHDHIPFEDGVWLSSENLVLDWFERNMNILNGNGEVIFFGPDGSPDFTQTSSPKMQNDSYGSIIDLLDLTEKIFKTIKADANKADMDNFLDDPQDLKKVPNAIQDLVESNLENGLLTPRLLSRQYAALYKKTRLFFTYADAEDIAKYNNLVACEKVPVFSDPAL